MQCEHLGKIIEIDPEQAAAENRIVLQLGKHKQMRQFRLYALTGAGRCGNERFKAAVERLALDGILTRITTNYKDSFLLKLTPRGEQCAQILADETRCLREKEQALKG